MFGFIKAYSELPRKSKKFPTLTFSKIGQHGRLGNQMFQIAATIGLAEAHGLSWDFFSDIDDCAAGRLFNLRGGLARSTRPLTVYKEIKQVYYNIELQNIREAEVISLHGYFQDYRYFSKSLVTLDQYFTTPHDLLQRVRAKVPELDSSLSVALHVRRGDYVQLNALYNLLDENYYIRALSMIRSKIDTVIIVSDDIPWCKRNLVPLIPYAVVFSPFKDDLSDFLLLHLSKVIIIANSSFSWWAAFLKYIRSHEKLNDSQIQIFAPALWYNSSGRMKHTNRDVPYPPSWTKVEIGNQSSKSTHK